jgi:hypothetical protein
MKLLYLFLFYWLVISQECNQLEKAACEGSCVWNGASFENAFCADKKSLSAGCWAFMDRNTCVSSKLYDVDNCNWKNNHCINEDAFCKSINFAFTDAEGSFCKVVFFSAIATILLIIAIIVLIIVLCCLCCVKVKEKEMVKLTTHTNSQMQKEFVEKAAQQKETKLNDGSSRSVFFVEKKDETRKRNEREEKEKERKKREKKKGSRSESHHVHHEKTEKKGKKEETEKESKEKKKKPKKKKKKKE